jgi:hypothetical protein
MRVARAIACSECVYLLFIKFDSQSTDLHSFSLSVISNSFTSPHPMRAFFFAAILSRRHDEILANLGGQQRDYIWPLACSR